MNLDDIIYGLMKFVTSADKAYQHLRREGYAVTRAVVREAWKRVGTQDRWARVIETWGVERKPHKSWLMESERLTSGEYQYIFEVDVYDMEKDEWKTRRISRVTDELITPERAYDELLWARIKYEVEQGQITLNWRVYGIYKRKS